MAKQAFGGRSISLSSQWVWDDDFGDEMSLNGHVVSGGAMYQANQWVEKGTGGKVLRSSMTRIGGGWDVFRTLTQSWSLDDPSWPSRRTTVRAPAAGRRGSPPAA